MADKPNFRAIDRLVRALPKPGTGNKTYSEVELRRRGLTGPWVRGLAPRVTTADARAWVMRYRAEGVERLHTIGTIEAWPAEKVWGEASELRRMVDSGADPRMERKAKQEAPTVNDLADRFEAEHLTKRRPSTARDYAAMLRQYIRPEFGPRKVAAIEAENIEALHARIAKVAPYRANRVAAVLSKMFALAIKWRMRADNPVRGIERAPEQKRQRYLSPAEIARLSAAIATHPERASANAVRLLLLTGARRGEVLSATWDQIDLAGGVWTKPAATTKQNRDHRIPLSAPALQLLAGMKADADAENERRGRYRLAPVPFLFPGKDGKPMSEIKHFWAAACRTAEIEGARIHDLRHTHASILASLGLSLPIIGALLGHTQAATTHRYAHLMDDPLRAATDRLGAVVAGAGQTGGDVVPMVRGRA